MPINTQKFRGKEVTTVDGTLEAIYINEIPADKVKTYKGPNGPWTPTHRYNIVVDGTRISLGMGDKDGVSDKQQLRCKDNDEQYHTLTRGMEVSVEVQENGEYKGVTQYQSSTGKLVITDTSNAQAPQQSSGGGAAKAPYVKKDNTQVVAGNARTAAFELHRFDDVFDVEAINATIAELVVYSDNKRKEYASSNPDLDDFQVGVSVGQAVVLAAQTVKSVEELDAIVNVILDEIIPFSVEQVKAVSAEKPKAAAKAVKTTKPAAKVTTRKASVVEDEPTQDDDFDSIPF